MASRDPLTQRQTPSPVEMAIEVGSMHPTGMHSCYLCI